MNRKRKSTDILAQLGEPLPLPYKANTSHIKNENSFDEVESAPPPIVYEPIRRRRLFEKRNVLETRESRPEHPSFDEHIPLPIWRRDRGSSSSAIVPDSENEGSEENEARELTIIDELQQQLDIIKTLYGSKDAIDADQGTFSKLSAMLQKIIERKQQESIVHELERIQKLPTQVDYIKQTNTRWRYGFWIGAIFLLLLSSFYAGQFSYEYCYYFC